MKKFNVKKLVLNVSSLMALGIASLLPNSYASDIEIYKAPQRGFTTLMFMIDISGSMTSEHTVPRVAAYACDMPEAVINSVIQAGTNTYFTGRYDNQGRQIHAYYDAERAFAHVGITRRTTNVSVPTFTGISYRKQQCIHNGTPYDDRITKVKEGMMDLLAGNPSKGITRIDDETVIGFSTLGANDGNRITVGTTPYMHGTILVPARPLNETVNGKSQRQILIETIAKLEANSATPTARSFAETVAYMMGKATDARVSGESASSFARSANEAKVGNLYKAPVSLTTQINSLKQGKDTRECSGQGIYVLTDGLPTNDNDSYHWVRGALSNNSFTCSATDTFECTEKLSSIILDKDNTMNPSKISIKTAVVGFGADFVKDGLDKWNPPVKPSSATKEELKDYEREYETYRTDYINKLTQNIRNTTGDTQNVMKAAKWGAVGKGGWYSGNSSAEVVQSVSSFLASLSVPIDTLPTGSPSIPVDTLNRQDYVAEAYYSTFTPRPADKYQLWTGDMNKYKVDGGILVDANNNGLFAADGTFNKNAKALWEAVGNLPIETSGNVINSKRKLMTNRRIDGRNAVNAERLQQVTVDNLFSGAFANDPHKNYWFNLLGYNVNRSATIANKNSLPIVELRQMGATMHSKPLLLTQSGKVVENGDDVEVRDRQDFLVYGSTQGLLHILDAKTGIEKFAFVPNEMMENQRDAFLHQESTFGGKDKLFYGIDGAWTAHSLYTVRADNVSTVLHPQGDRTKAHQWIYGGLRMGGRSYYALDLSDMENPQIKFHINPATNTVHRADSSTAMTFPELQFMGQSWSRPALGYVNWRNAAGATEPRLVMFVGGGYDAGGTDGTGSKTVVKTEDRCLPAEHGYECSDYQQTNGRGAGVYMFDANTGELLWWASNNNATNGTVPKLSHGDLKYSVATRINALDRDSDGLIDNLYFGDLAGQAFRIDLNNEATNPNDFGRRVERLFSEHKTDGTSPRFYEMPSIGVFADDSQGKAGKHFATISFVSGDRSSPYTAGPYTNEITNQEYNNKTAQDGVFVVYDNDVNKRDLYEKDYQLLTNEATSSLQEVNLSTGVPRMNGTGDTATYNRGWKYIFPENKQKSGSLKGVNEPRTFVNFLYTYMYDKHTTADSQKGQCGSGVIGVTYNVRFCLPTGVCEVGKHGFTNSDSRANFKGDANQPYRSQTGPGIITGEIGGGKDGITNIINPQAEPIKARIETEINKIRWYESK